MQRREFTAGLLFAAATRPAWAQQRATPPRIAIFHPAIPVALLTETGGGTAWRAFFGELRRLGYVEGKNLIVERYSAEGHHERYADLAREIVARNPDLIVTGPNPVVIAFRAATSAIPVVAFMVDPLEAGLVTSLARPGGNLTGITLDPGVEIWAKRLELLKEAIPSTVRVAFLAMREGWDGSFGQLLQDAGITAPEPPYRVPVAVVPFGPAGAELAEAIAIGPDIPGFRDQFHAGEPRILPHRRQEAPRRIEAGSGPGESGREVEPKAVDMHDLHPIAKAVHYHLKHSRMLQIEGVARACVVDI